MPPAAPDEPVPPPPSALPHEELPPPPPEVEQEHVDEEDGEFDEIRCKTLYDFHGESLMRSTVRFYINFAVSL